MTIGYRRMLLFGPNAAVWEYPAPEVAERLLASPSAGIGSIGDQRNDAQQYWESRTNGGTWKTFSYWPGAIDFWVRGRLMVVERLANDVRLLGEKAQRLREGAGAAIQGYRDQIAALEGAIKAAQEDEKRSKAEARELDKKADAIRAEIAPIEREIERGAPETVSV